MGIIKNKIPILEYDTDPKAVIMPDHEKLEIRLPGKAVFALNRKAAPSWKWNVLRWLPVPGCEVRGEYA